MANTTMPVGNDARDVPGHKRPRTSRTESSAAGKLDDLPGWEAAMIAELGARRFQGRWIRIHDSGDFFSDDYLAAWLRVCRARPGVQFYAYTKEVARFRRLVEPAPPPNLRWVYSYGGTQDNALDPALDRVADVFTDDAAIAAAGWSSQDRSDLLAVLGPRLVGIPANRIPAYLKRLAGRRFSQWQADVDAARAAQPNSGWWRRYPAAHRGNGAPDTALHAWNRGPWRTQPAQRAQPAANRDVPN